MYKYNTVQAPPTSPSGLHLPHPQPHTAADVLVPNVWFFLVIYDSLYRRVHNTDRIKYKS